MSSVLELLSIEELKVRKKFLLKELNKVNNLIIEKENENIIIEPQKIIVEEKVIETKNIKIKIKIKK